MDNYRARARIFVGPELPYVAGPLCALESKIHSLSQK